jgi:hypothetical protein
VLTTHTTILIILHTDITLKDSATTVFNPACASLMYTYAYLQRCHIATRFVHVVKLILLIYVVIICSSFNSSFVVFAVDLLCNRFDEWPTDSTDSSSSSDSSSSGRTVAAETLYSTFVNSCGCGMIILTLLDFVRLALGIPLHIAG